MQRTTPLAGLRPTLKPGVVDIPHVTTFRCDAQRARLAGTRTRPLPISNARATAMWRSTPAARRIGSARDYGLRNNLRAENALPLERRVQRVRGDYSRSVFRPGRHASAAACVISPNTGSAKPRAASAGVALGLLLNRAPNSRSCGILDVRKLLAKSGSPSRRHLMMYGD